MRRKGREGAGAGHRGQGRVARFHFEVFKPLKITFLQLFEKKGEGRAGQGLGSEHLGAGQHRARAKARAKGRAGCRAGSRQGAGAGHRGQGRVARFHFEVFKA